MAKDPAFLFYSSDFLTGTALFSFEQRGIYIFLLCLQHQQGGICEDDMKQICGTHLSVILKKFKKSDDNLYYQQRLTEEINKRKSYSESRAKNRLGRKENNEPEPKNDPSTYVPHMEDENENENRIRKKKKKKDPPPEILVLPFDSERFKKIWEGWVKYKKREFDFDYKSIESQQAALMKLGNLSGGDEDVAVTIIIESMANGWQGLFAIKNNNNGKQIGNNGTKADYYNAMEAELETGVGTPKREGDGTVDF